MANPDPRLAEAAEHAKKIENVFMTFKNFILPHYAFEIPQKLKF
jgi:hypothetical protein